MIETKHTPGPWSIEGDVAEGGFYLSEYNHGAEVPIFLCEWFLGDAVTAKSNARLIAAAPDMLEALKACADNLASLGWHPAEQVARDAIAKAEGRS
jgi:hypothetical protein